MQKFLSEKKAALQKELVELSLANRAWLDSQSDLNNACPIEVRLDNGETVVISPGVVTHYNKRIKPEYEGGGFQKVEKSLTKKNDPLYAALRKRYNQGKMCMEEEQKSQRYKQQQTFIQKEGLRSENGSTDGATSKIKYESLREHAGDSLDLLAEKIARYPSFDAFSISLINLVHQLNIIRMQKDSTALPQQYVSIPAVIQEMVHVFSHEEFKNTDRLVAIKKCKNNLSKVLSEGKGQIIAALVFVLAAAVSIALGIYLALALGFMTGILGVKMIGVAVISGMASYCAFWHHQHASIREALYQMFEAGQASVEANKKNTAPLSC